MTVSTLRPNATTSNTGALTGATAHGALSDDSDATYIDFDPSEAAIVELSDLTLPSGDVIKGVRVRARSALVGSAGVLEIEGPAPSTLIPSASVIVSWFVATTTTVVTSLRTGITDADADGATLLIGASASSGTLRVYEAFVDITHVAQPAVTVTAPSGTVADTNEPTIEWSVVLDSDGGVGRYYEVKVYTDAQYGAGGFDPDTSTPTVSVAGAMGGAGEPTSVTSWQVDEILPDDVYRVYVRVAQLVNGEQHWSDWDSSDFEIDVALPAVPDITATADSANSRITLLIDDNAGDATTDELEVQRSLDGGTTWETVRQLVEGSFDVADTPITLYDYEAPNGTTMHYRARALHDYSGVLAASAWATDTEAWSSGAWWLKHPHQPALNMQVVPSSLPTLTRAGRQGVFQPLGASSVVVVSDTRSPATGAVTLRALTTAAQQDLDDLLDEVATLMLQSPAEEGGPDYIRVINHTRSRIVDNKDATRVWELLEFVVTTSPSGDVVEWPS